MTDIIDTSQTDIFGHTLYIKIKKPKEKKPKPVFDFNDMRKYLLAKNYIRMENGETFYIYENLVYKTIQNGVEYIQNISGQMLEKMYLKNFKKLQKYNKYKDLLKRNEKELSSVKNGIKRTLLLKQRTNTLTKLSELKKQVFLY